MEWGDLAFIDILSYDIIWYSIFFGHVKFTDFFTVPDVAGMRVWYAYFYGGFSRNFLHFSAFAFLLLFYLSLIYFPFLICKSFPYF